MTSAEDDIRQDFTDSLQELTFNSRPIISTLTSIAQEYVQHAELIARLLCDHLRKTIAAYKLPAFYLLDSICKNVGSPYTIYFGRDLYRLFMDVYTTVDPVVRQKLEELLVTWKQPLPGSHSANPVFPFDVTRKIEAALNKAREALEQLRLKELQERQKMYPQIPAQPQHVHPQMMPQHMIPPPPPQQQAPVNLNDLLPILQAQGQAPPPPPQQYSAPIPPPINDASALMASLQSAGLIPMPLNQAPAADSYQLPVPAPNNFINEITKTLTLNNPYFEAELTQKSLEIPRPIFIRTLYEGYPKQCVTCGRRFKDDDKGKQERQDHVDWHFRVNKRLRELTGRGSSRGWYMNADSWVNISKADGNPAESIVTVDVSAAFIPVPSDPILATKPCPICKDKFKSVWREKEEEWVWENAVNDRGVIYHATCHAETMASLASERKSALKRKADEAELEDGEVRSPPGDGIVDVPTPPGDNES